MMVLRLAAMVVGSLVAAGCTGGIGPSPVVPDASVPAQPTVPMAPPQELATRLARFLWAGEPTAALQLDALAARSPEAVGALAERMLRDSRARAGMAAFFRWWLLLDELTTMPKQDPGQTMTPELRDDLRREAETTGVSVLFDDDARLETLLRAPYTFVNERLARHYGMANVSGAELRKVPFDTPRRVGIFGGAGVLTRFASYWQPTWPAKRTWLVLSVALCQPLATGPPIDEESDPGKPIRSQMIEATAPSGCMVCHYMLNEPGFAFLEFDTLGRFRPTDAGGAQDTSGKMPEEFLSAARRFDGQPDLMSLLATRPETRRCMAQAWLQFATAPELPHPSLPPPDAEKSIDEVVGAFERSGWDLRALAPAVARSEAFVRPTPYRWR